MLVVSYTTLSPLPLSRRFAFCGTVPRVAPGGRYPPPRPVESGLSSTLARRDHLADSSRDKGTSWLVNSLKRCYLEHMTRSLTRSLVAASSALFLAMTGTVIAAGSATADTNVKPRISACTADPNNYACLRASARREVAGEAITFTGTLSRQAQRNLTSWTRGENTICLTRYDSKPRRNGSWPWQTLDAACTTLNPNGTFGMTVFLGVQGQHFYGVEMGPCRASADECGNGDPGLIGVGSNKKNRVVAVRTVAR